MDETQTVLQYLSGFYTLKSDAEHLKINNPILTQLCMPEFYVPHLVKNLVPMLRGYAFYLSDNTNVTWPQFKSALIDLALSFNYTPTTNPPTSVPPPLSFYGSNRPGSSMPEQTDPRHQYQNPRGSRGHRRAGGSKRGNSRGGYHNFDQSYSHHSPYNTRRGGPNRFTTLICDYCKRPGHHINDCRQRQRQQQNQRSHTNYNLDQYQPQQQQQFWQPHQHQNHPQPPYLPLPAPPPKQQQNHQQLQIMNTSNHHPQTDMTQPSLRSELTDVLNKWGLSAVLDTLQPHITPPQPSTASGPSSNRNQQATSEEVFPEPWARG